MNNPAPVVTCAGIDVAANSSVYVTINFTMSVSDIPIDEDGGDSVENSLTDNGVSTCATSDSISSRPERTASATRTPTLKPRSFSRAALLPA